MVFATFVVGNLKSNADECAYEDKNSSLKVLSISCFLCAKCFAVSIS